MGNPELENEQSVGVEFAITRNEGDLNQNYQFIIMIMIILFISLIQGSNRNRFMA